MQICRIRFCLCMPDARGEGRGGGGVVNITCLLYIKIGVNILQNVHVYIYMGTIQYTKFSQNSRVIIQVTSLM